MTVSEFLHQMALSSGAEIDNPALKLILADPNLAKLEIPKEYETLVGDKFKGMITLDAAKQNAELKKYFLATSLYGVDKDIERLARNEMGLTDDEISSLKRIDNTQKRLEEFAKISKEKLSKMAPATDDEKAKKLANTINELNRQLAEKDESFKAKEKEIAGQYLNKMSAQAKKELFRQYQYTDSLPISVQTQTAQALLDENLRKNNYKVTFNEESNSLKLLTDADTEVFVNNKPVNINQYVESLLAENKLLKVTPINKTGDAKTKEPIIVQSTDTSKKVNNAAFLQALEASAQGFAQQAD